MPPTTATSSSFEALWQSVIDQPVQQDDEAADDAELLSAAQLVAWLRRIAGECLADALITEAEHTELQACSDTFERVLGAVPPEALREKLKTLSDTEA